MRLSLEPIKKITVGALNVWEEDGGFHFAKCTPMQVMAWYQRKRVLGEHSETTTGVRLDFHTNSKYFSFTVKDKLSDKTRYEIYIDDVLCHYYQKGDFRESMKKYIELDGEEHRITLYLPAHGVGVLESVNIEDGATLAPHKFDRKILFIGDSITQGCGSTWDSLSYANHVSRFFNAESVIQGIGGAFYLETTFDDAIDFDPDIVIVAYGTNDWTTYKTLEEGREHCKLFLERLVEKYGEKKLFGISPLWRADMVHERDMGSFEACTSYVKEEIKRHGMILIDGETLTPHVKDFYVDEHLHPNAKGFGIYALNLIAQIQIYLN